MTKKKESEKQRYKREVAALMKDLARPRMSQSAREAEDASHRLLKHDSFLLGANGRDIAR